jgi:hypothetical protein
VRWQRYVGKRAEKDSRDRWKYRERHRQYEMRYMERERERQADWQAGRKKEIQRQLECHG